MENPSLKKIGVGSLILACSLTSVSAKEVPNPIKEENTSPGGISVDEKGTPAPYTPSTRPVTQDFGVSNPKLYGKGKHDGIDIGNKCGEEVKSPTNGRVTEVSEDSTYGTHLWIQGYDGYKHLLGHTTVSAKVGDSVVKGTVVGSTNNSGHSTACHLHWTVTLNGKLIDPKVWMKEPELCPGLVNVPALYGVQICQASEKYQADPSLLAALMWTENRGWPETDKNVCSPMGACGIMQFMPGTFEQYKIDVDGNGASRESWLDSIHSAAHYIGRMKKNWRDTAITYNNSWKNVGKPDSQLPAETRQYLGIVAEKYKEFKKGA